MHQQAKCNLIVVTLALVAVVVVVVVKVQPVSWLSQVETFMVTCRNQQIKRQKKTELAVNAQVEVMAKYLGHGMSLKGRFYMLFAKK